MPIWLRNFTFNKINEHYKKEQEAYDKANKGSNTTTVVDASGKVQTPELAQKASTGKRKAIY
jgi:hypothetical protein